MLSLSLSAKLSHTHHDPAILSRNLPRRSKNRCPHKDLSTHTHLKYTSNHHKTETTQLFIHIPLGSGSEAQCSWWRPQGLWPVMFQAGWLSDAELVQSYTPGPQGLPGPRTEVAAGGGLKLGSEYWPCHCLLYDPKLIRESFWHIRNVILTQPTFLWDSPWPPTLSSEPSHSGLCLPCYRVAPWGQWPVCSPAASPGAGTQ